MIITLAGRCPVAIVSMLDMFMSNHGTDRPDESFCGISSFSQRHQSPLSLTAPHLSPTSFKSGKILSIRTRSTSPIKLEQKVWCLSRSFCLGDKKALQGFFNPLPESAPPQNGSGK